MPVIRSGARVAAAAVFLGVALAGPTCVAAADTTDAGPSGATRADARPGPRAARAAAASRGRGPVARQTPRPAAATPQSARRTLLPAIRPIPKVAVTDSAAVEGADPARFTVTLDRAYRSPVTVGYATATATPAGNSIQKATAGVDYTPVSGKLTFAPGQTSQQLSVAVLDDADVESTEQFDLRIFAVLANQVTGLALASGRATIFNNDLASSVTSANVDLSDWMSTLPGIGGRPLTTLPIPGTHDSGTYSMTRNSPWALTGISDFGLLTKLPGWLGVKSRVAPWSKTQPNDVFTQLVDGIRYLDLRLSNEADGIYIEHGLRGPAIDEVLTDIARFAEARPREVVLVDMARFTNFDATAHTALLEQIRQTLGRRLAPDTLGASATLPDFWASDRNIVLIYSDPAVADADADLWPAGTIYQPWPNVQTVEPLLEANRRYLQLRDPARIWGLSGTVTPDARTIVKGLLFGVFAPTSIERLMKGVHPALQDWLRNEFRASVNLVTTDWYSAKWVRGSYVRDVLGSVDGAYL